MWLRRKAKIAQNMWQGSTFFFKNCYSWKFEFQWRKITISELSETKMFSAKSNENCLKLSELRTKGRNLRLLRSLIVKACVQDCQNPKKHWWKQENQGHKAACLRRFSRISTKLWAIFADCTNYGRICVYDAFIKAYLANRLKSIIYTRGRYLCTDIHWHLRPCLTVMWLATRPYKH